MDGGGFSIHTQGHLTQSFDHDDDYHDVHLFEDGSYLVVMLEEVVTDLSDMEGPWMLWS